jgi:hypothetical protein
MAVTVVRGVVGHPNDSGSSSRSPDAVFTAATLNRAPQSRGGGEGVRSALEQAVMSNRPSKRPRSDKVRDATEARHLAADVSEEIRSRGTEESHDGLEPIVAREHFRRH